MFAGKTFLALALALGGLYGALVVWAKLGTPPVQLGERGEFLLFFLAILSFSIQVLIEDHRARAAAGSAEEPQ